MGTGSTAVSPVGEYRDGLSGRGWPGQGTQGETAEMLACRGEIMVLAASIHAAEARLTERIAELVAGEGWVGSGVRNVAHWLTLTCGFTSFEARQRADMAARRAELPSLFGAFDSGSLSLGALRCAERVATPENDEEVTHIATTATGPQAARTFASFRRAATAEKQRQREIEERRNNPNAPDNSDGVDGSDDAPLSPGGDDVDASDEGDPATWMRMWWDEYQYLRIDGRLDTTDGAAFKALLDAIQHDAENSNRTDPDRTDPDRTNSDTGSRNEPAETDRVDLDLFHNDDTGDPSGFEIVEDDPDLGTDSESGGLPSCTRSRKRLSWVDAFSRLTRLAGDALVDANVRGRWEDRFAVSVTIEAEVLLGAKHGCGVLDDGAPVDPATVRDWLPASTLEGLICDRGAPLFMGRKIRVANRKARRALKVRDRGCAFPGCDCTEYLDAHHIYIWDNGALTNIDELVLLCRRHHRLFHLGEYMIVMIDGHPHFQSDVLGTGMPPPKPLTELQATGPMPPVSPDATRRSGERLTFYAQDVFLCMLFGATQTKRSKFINTIG